MTSVAYTVFFPYVLPHVLGCPDPVLINAIRNAAIDLCTKTNVWQETQDPETVSALGLPYDLTGPTGASVIQVLSCKADGVTITPVTIDYLDERHTNWEEQTGTAHHYFQPNTSQLSLYPIPVADTVLRLRVAYAPTRASTTTDSDLFENNVIQIAAGALAALLIIPNVTWTDPKLSMYYESIFNAGITTIQNDVQKQFGRARNRVRSNPF